MLSNDEVLHFDGNFVSDSKYITFANKEYLPWVLLQLESSLREPKFDHLVSSEHDSKKKKKKKNLKQLLKISGNNLFNDLLIKMQFLRAVLSNDLRLPGIVPKFQFILSKFIDFYSS